MSAESLPFNQLENEGRKEEEEEERAGGRGEIINEADLVYTRLVKGRRRV